VRYRKGHPRPTDRFSVADMRRLFAVMNGDAPIVLRDRALVALALDAGPRVEELATIRLRDLDADAVTLFGKGGKTRRVGVSPEARQYIDAYLADGRTALHPTNDRLFVSVAGAPLTYTALRNRLKYWAGRAGIAHATWHQFRVAFATHHWLCHRSEIELQLALGHATLAMTRRYVRLAQEEEAGRSLGADSLLRSISGPDRQPVSGAAQMQPATPARYSPAEITQIVTAILNQLSTTPPFSLGGHHV
jgi:site-specific recombinase XerD